MADRIRPNQDDDDLDLENAETLTDEGGGVAEAAFEEDELIDEDEDDDD